VRSPGAAASVTIHLWVLVLLGVIVVGFVLVLGLLVLLDLLFGLFGPDEWD
jgi:hypothetical protein